MKGILNSNFSSFPVPEMRFLEPEDAPVLMRLRHRAIQECDVNFGTPVQVELAREVSYYRRQLIAYRDLGGAALIGYWKDGTLAGMTGIRLRKYRGEQVGLIYSTFIEQPFRGQGLGKRLVEEGRRQIRQGWNISHCIMHVEVLNLNAIQLYQDCGFAITRKQEQAFWIEGVAHDVYVMEATENRSSRSPSGKS